MRTAVFFGLMIVAEAIRPDWLIEEAAPFVFTILLIMMVMDVIDFLFSKREK
jgi:hypothetical protein